METSAFGDLVEDVEMENQQAEGKGDEAEILEQKMRAQLETLTPRFAHMHIDFKAVQLYFKQLKMFIKNNSAYKDAIRECVDVIDF